MAKHTSLTMRIRRGLLFVSFLGFPIVQFYLSPYLPFAGAMEGLVAGSLLVFAGLFLAGLFVGRAPCGWFMPCGGLQEACFHVRDRRIPTGPLDGPKFAIWVPWLSALIGVFVVRGVAPRLSPLYHIDGGISVSQPWLYFIYYGVLLIFVGLAFALGKRAACHYLCWVAPFMILGRRLGDALRLPGLRLLPRSGAACTSCGTCSKACPMGVDPSPVARGEAARLDECLLCGECVDACPSLALRLGLGRARRPARPS